MLLSPPKITCLFYTDPSLPVFLNTPTGRALAGDLLVECSGRPALGYALNLETPSNYPGVSGLLGGVDIGTLAHATDALPAPILLAPGAPVSPLAIRAGLARLTRPDERLRTVTLLVPVSEARILGAALAIADRFALAWDATTFPHEELIDFARWLATEHIITPQNFAVVQAYTTTTGLAATAHTQRMNEILRPLNTRVISAS